MGGNSSSWDSGKSDYKWDKSPSVTKRSAADYAKQDKREYNDNTPKGIDAPVRKDITTNSDLAAILMVDQTGSMDFLPKEMFIKWATLYEETNAALQGINVEDLVSGKVTMVEPKLEMAVLAIGDARGDERVLQVVDFGKGSALVNGVKKIEAEGNGQGNARESYDLGAYFLVKHCQTPNVKKPLLIIVGDEGFYEQVSRSHVKEYIGDCLSEDLDTKVLMREMASKFDTFLLRPEFSAYPESTYKQIHEQWRGVLNPERVMRMKDPHRYVDCVVSCACIYADNLKNLVPLLERRQVDEDSPSEGLGKVHDVLETLHPVLGDKFVKKEMGKLEKKYQGR